MDTHRDSTFNSAHTSDTVQDFFERPVRIWQDEWEIGVNHSFMIDPWSLFFTDERVKVRMNNFANLTADLHLRILVNGNPFYYGCGLWSYIPLQINDDRSEPSPSTSFHNVQASQMPHIYVDPCESAGGDMVLPFIYFKNAVHIHEQEWGNLGLLRFSIIAPLQHANEGTESITMTIYAMAKNVKVTTPTGITYENQADEYSFSTIASSVSNALNYLKMPPMISPYIRATQMVMSATASVAQLFGYSRPRIVDEPHSVRPRYAASLAVTNAMDNVSSLAFDSKKEVTIDPRVVGLEGLDEMAILPIAQKESFVTTVNWSTSSAVDAHLFSIRATPIQGQISGGEYAVTPSAWVQLPFRYWKGSFKVRCTIVASAYHKGRLRFVWDPIYNKAANKGFHNTNYSTIVDIGKERDVVFNIGWGQNTTYLRQGGLQSIPNYSLTEYTEPDIFSNGVLSVYVVNGLTCPALTSEPVTLVFHTSMGEDYEVACPDSSIFNGLQIATRTATIPNPVVTQPFPLPAPPAVVPAQTTPTTAVFSPQAVPSGAGSQLFQANYTTALITTTGFAKTYAPGGGELPHYFIELPFEGSAGVPQEFSLIANPITNVNSAQATYDVDIVNVVIDGVTQSNPPISTTPMTYSYSTSTPTAVNGTFTFTPNISKGTIRFKIRFPTEQLVKQLSYPASFGIRRAITNAQIAAGTASGGAVLTTTSGVNSVAWNSADGLFLIPVTQFSLLGDALITFVNQDIPSGHGHYARFKYSDGTYSSDSQATASSFQAVSGAKTTLTFRIKSSVPKTVDAIEIRPYNASNTVFSTVLAGVIAYHPNTVQNQSEEVPAPVNGSITESMGPTVENNSNLIHFGELITSWRQVLKRYVSVVEGTFPDGECHLLVKDGGVSGFDALNVAGLHPIDYVTSAYVAYRGGTRYKILFHSDDGIPLSGFARITRVAQSMVETSADTSLYGNYAVWDGCIWEPIGLTQVLDAEIPYYSLLRFYPGRLSANSSTITSNDTYYGRERSTFKIDFHTKRHTRLEITRAIAEDYSLHFFLSTPLLKVGPS